MTTAEFFERLFGYAEEGLWTYLWTLPDKRTYSFQVTQLRQMADKAIALSAEGKEVYFSVGLASRPFGEHERAKAADIVALPALWADVDILSSAHKAQALPPTVADAETILPDMFDPTIVVHSGHGLQPYYVFREPEDAKDCAGLCERLQAVMRGRAALSGWTLDATHDSARILRVPGTINHKGAPVAVQVIQSSGQQGFEPAYFDDLLPEVRHEASPAGNVSHAFERRPTDGTVADILSNCAFLRDFVERVSEKDEPACKAAYSNLLRACDGEAFCWGLCQKGFGEKFDPRKTRERLGHYLDCPPQSCEYISRTFRFIGCAKCQRYSEKNPASWALSVFGQSLAWCRAQEKFTDEMIEDSINRARLSVVERAGIAEWEEIKKKFDRNLRTYKNWSKADRIERNRKAAQEAAWGSVIHGGGNDEAAVAALESGKPVIWTTDVYPNKKPQLMIPAGYEFTPGGIFKRKGEGDLLFVTSTPIIITAQVRNLDTGKEYMKVDFCRNRKWHSELLKRSDAFVSRELVKLADAGMNISSETARHVVDFLAKLEGRAENQQAIPSRLAVSRLGWRGKEFIMPYSEKYIVQMDDDGAAQKAYAQMGTLEAWAGFGRRVREHLPARVLIAASFLPPLLKILGGRNFTAYAHGHSASGKTAAMVFALSAWGDPELLMKSFNGTMSSIERAAIMANDTVLALDERQSAMGGRDKQENIERIVYMLGQGVSKGRATKTGRQAEQKFRTVCIASGEEPIFQTASMQGVKTRLLEFDSGHMPDGLAHDIYRFTKECFGTPIRAYLDELLSADPKELRESFGEMLAILRDEYQECFDDHRQYAAMLAVADMLASQWVFGEEGGAEGAAALARFIMDGQPSAEEISDASRAWGFVADWLKSNRQRFSANGIPANAVPEYGFIKDEYYHVYPSCLTKALQDAGFVPKKVLREMAEAGNIESQHEGGKQPRLRWTVKLHDGTRVIKIHVF